MMKYECENCFQYKIKEMAAEQAALKIALERERIGREKAEREKAEAEKRLLTLCTEATIAANTAKPDKLKFEIFRIVRRYTKPIRLDF